MNALTKTWTRRDGFTVHPRGPEYSEGPVGFGNELQAALAAAIWLGSQPGDRTTIHLTGDPNGQIFAVPEAPVGCQWIDEYPGPHPGCAEFAPPDVDPCGDLATRAQITYSERPHSPEPGDQSDESMHYLEHFFCDHHAGRAREELAVHATGDELIAERSLHG